VRRVIPRPDRGQPLFWCTRPSPSALPFKHDKIHYRVRKTVTPRINDLQKPRVLDEDLHVRKARLCGAVIRLSLQ